MYSLFFPEHLLSENENLLHLCRDESKKPQSNNLVVPLFSAVCLPMVFGYLRGNIKEIAARSIMPSILENIFKLHLGLLSLCIQLTFLYLLFPKDTEWVSMDKA